MAKRTINEKIQLSITGKFNPKITFEQSNNSSIIVSNTYPSEESMLSAIAIIPSVMKNVNSSNIYYTKTVLVLGNGKFLFYNIDSYYQVTIKVTNTILEQIEQVIASKESTALIWYPSGNIIFSSEMSLNPDGTYIKTGYDFTQKPASNYYVEGEYKKMLRYLMKDKKLTEYRTKGYLMKDLLNPAPKEPINSVEIWINSELIYFNGIPAARETYFIQ